MVKVAARKFFGVALILIGIFALFTPLTPGSWLVFLGLEFLGVRVLARDQVKGWFQKARQRFTRRA
ncbi:MAG: hypothetical protein HY470_00195 [Candidatus Ryanbacteria bacterium]|nr:hypothetical protein [Candidatus Ryanbacteria bacterium]